MKTIRQVCSGIGLTAVFTFSLLFSTASFANNDEAALIERLEKLEKKQKKLNKKVKKNSKKTTKKINELKSRVAFNGFFSSGFVKASEDISTTIFNQYRGIDDDLCSDCKTILGIQMTFKLDDKTDVVGQFVSEGATSRELKTDWGYLRHKLNGNAQISAGRMVTPYYMKSQYQTVAFALPWIETPSSYITTARYFDGIDFKYSFNAGNFDGNTLVYWGTSKIEGGSFDFGFDKLKGFVFEGGFGNFKFNLGYHNAELYITDVGRSAQFSALATGLDSIGAEHNVTVDGNKTDFYTLGFEYDDGVNLLLGEVSKIVLEEGLVSPSETWYITYGRRFNSWMPYITYSKLKSPNDHTRRVNSVQTTISNAQQDIANFMTFAQGQLATIDGSDPVADQETLAVIAQASQNETLIAGVAAGVIDAHDMAGIVAGMTSNITDLDAVSAGLEVQKDIQQTLYSIGVNKTLTPKVAVKAQYSVYTDFGDGASHGVFQTKTNDDDVKIYYLILTAVF